MNLGPRHWKGWRTTIVSSRSGPVDTIAIGAPYVAGAKVTATVQEHGKGDKVVIVKFRRRKHYKREKTHRQPYTEIKVTGITGA